MPRRDKLAGIYNYAEKAKWQIQMLRFDKALSLLRKPNQAIAPIANLCGYASEPFFKRLFKKKTGLTMREWRKKNAASQS